MTHILCLEPIYFHLGLYEVQDPVTTFSFFNVMMFLV